MKLLLSNDDGVHSPGLQTLYDTLLDLGELRVSRLTGITAGRAMP